jgi:peptidoglycan hydrolase CwlO-like protein
MSAEEPTNAEMMTVLLQQADTTAGIVAVLENHTKRFDAVEAKVDAVQARVDAVQAKVDAVEAKVDTVQARVDAVEAKVDRVEAKVDVMSEDVVGIKVNQALIEHHIDDVYKWVRRHEANPNAHDRAA